VQQARFERISVQATIHSGDTATHQNSSAKKKPQANSRLFVR
jgi:hypothetical protein